MWGHRNRRIQENNYSPADTIFHLICHDVRLRISGLQQVVDSSANRSMCERWSFPLNILSPGRLAAALFVIVEVLLPCPGCGRFIMMVLFARIVGLCFFGGFFVVWAVACSYIFRGGAARFFFA